MRHRFKILIAVMLVAIIITLVCAVGLVWSDIQKLKADLNHLYWVEEHAYSFPEGLIEIAEARLQQKQTVLTSLIVVTTLIILASIIVCIRILKRVKT